MLLDLTRAFDEHMYQGISPAIQSGASVAGGPRRSEVKRYDRSPALRLHNPEGSVRERGYMNAGILLLRL